MDEVIANIKKRGFCYLCCVALPTDEYGFIRSAKTRCSECFKKENDAREAAKKEKSASYRNKRKDKKRQYGLDNPQQKAQRRLLRCSSGLRAIPKWGKDEFEVFAIGEAKRLVNLRSKLTGVKHHLDHMVPLQSKSVCGLHCIANMAVIPAILNISKGNRYWPDMP